MARRTRQSAPTTGNDAAQTRTAGVAPAKPSDAVSAPIARRRRIFALIAIAIPFILVLAAELLCRTAGYGGYPPIIKHVGSDGRREWFTTYRPGTDTFFRRGSGAGGMRELAFYTPKSSGAVRIGIFGDSAAQGFPQPLPLTNGSFLAAILDDAWAGSQRAEVLNFGCTAVASFVSANILDAALQRELDLLIIMAGNNEFYGAYGVASMHGAGRSVWGMNLARWSRRSALVQWLDALVSRTAATPTDEDERRQVLMERVAAVQQIGPDDALRSAAASAARVNIERMLHAAAARRVPVILCTLPTNERDLFPIGVDIEPPLAPAKLAEFQRLLQQGEALLSTDAAAAAAALQSAIERYAAHARSHFLLARALNALGRRDDARREYVAARDLDPMPWRATSAINDAVRAAAAAHPTAILCDLEAAFRSECPDGAIGWELMDDHVHLSLRGQALFASTVAQAMTTLSGRLHVDAARLAQRPAWEEYARRLGRNDFDAYAAALHVARLFDAEFMQRTNPEAQQRATARLAMLRNGMTELDRRAVDEWADQRSLHVAVDRPITSIVGAIRMNAGDYAGAAEAFHMAHACASNISLWRLQYAVDYLRCRRRLSVALTESDVALAREAIQVGELLRRFTTLPQPAGPACLGLAYGFAGDYSVAARHLEHAVRHVRGPQEWYIIDALIEALLKTGQAARARQLLMMALNEPALRDGAARRLAQLDGATAAP
jgi:tetratricopeptide (TPR) repeat protein